MIASEWGFILVICSLVLVLGISWLCGGKVIDGRWCKFIFYFQLIILITVISVIIPFSKLFSGLFHVHIVCLKGFLSHVFIIRFKKVVFPRFIFQIIIFCLSCWFGDILLLLTVHHVEIPTGPVSIVCLWRHRISKCYLLWAHVLVSCNIDLTGCVIDGLSLIGGWDLIC